MATPGIRANWGESLVPDLRKWTEDGFKSHPLMIDRVFKVGSSDRAFEEDQNSASYQEIPESSEGAGTPIINRQKGYGTRYTHKIYKAKMQVTREAYDDDQYNIWKKDAMVLGKNGALTVNNNAYGMFRDGFTSTATSYGDSKPLFSTGHTRADGGTAQSNASSTGITLTEANLQIARVALRQQLSDLGSKANIAAGKLVLMVPEQLEKTAYEIIDSAKRSGTSDNDMNYHMGKYEVFVNPFIGSDISGGSDTAWYLIAMGEHDLNFFWRVKPEITNDYEGDKDKFEHKIYMRFSKGWSDWRATWGSKGDEAAYSG